MTILYFFHVYPCFELLRFELGGFELGVFELGGFELEGFELGGFEAGAFGYCEVGYGELEVLFEPEVGFFFELEEFFELDFELGLGLCLELELELEDLWPDFGDLVDFFSLGGYSSLGSLILEQLLTPGNSLARPLVLSRLRPLVAMSN